MSLGLGHLKSDFMFQNKALDCKVTMDAWKYVLKKIDYYFSVVETVEEFEKDSRAPRGN